MPRILLVLACALVLLAGCDSTTEPDDHDSGGRLELTLPGSVEHGEPFTLRVEAVAADGTRPDPAFAGAVALTVTAGAITPQTFTLNGGEAAAQVTIAGTAATVAVTASAGGRSGTSAPTLVRISRLPGEVVAPLTPAIPLIAPASGPADFTTTAPGFGGAPVSLRTLLVLPAAGATVGDVNAFLAAHDGTIIGGLPDDHLTGGALMLRFPLDDYTALLALRDQLAGADWVAAVSRDAAVAEELEPVRKDAPAPNWVWADEPGGGNWGLELIRAPQLWNLNGAVARTGRRVSLGVIDTGFRRDHPDLVFVRMIGDKVGEHGTHVSGIIGAAWNRLGVDGLCPFADLSAFSTVDWSASSPGDSLLSNGDWGTAIMDQLFGRLILYPGLRVVNMSLGYPWVIDTANNTAMQELASEQGAWLAAALGNLPDGAGQPLIVVAAGNESNVGFGLQDARWASPMANAAIEHGVENILVIESLLRDAAASGGATRSDFSNVGGFLSAPGSAVMSTSITPDYEPKSGTSMAAPHVTGLIAYLYALDPDLTHEQIRDILEISAVPVGGGANPRIDAFGAAMAVDWANAGEPAVLRMLADIDDGTLDGNQRTQYVSGSPNLDEDADGNGGPGDGRVDMSDFRRFRDWLLQIEQPGDLFLDGAAEHPKKDVDGDGEVEDSGSENVFPRGDLNGDGELHRTATAAVGGAVNGTVTDLQVLQRVFDDPDVQADELPGLLDSGDFIVDGSTLLFLDQADHVIANVLEPENLWLVAQRTLTFADPLAVITVPMRPTGYRLTATLYDAAGNQLASLGEDFGLQRGEDKFWQPTPGPRIVLEVTAPGQVGPGTDFPVDVRAGLQDALGEVAYQAGIAISLQVTAGTASPAAGVTDADGYFTSAVTPNTGAGLVTIFVTATWEDLPEVVLPRQVIVASLGRVTPLYNRSLVYAGAGGDAGDDICNDSQEFVPLEDDWGPHALSLDASCAVTHPEYGSRSASASTTHDMTVTFFDGAITSIVGDAQSETRQDPFSSPFVTVGATSISEFALWFEVQNGTVAYDVSGTLTPPLEQRLSDLRMELRRMFDGSATIFAYDPAVQQSVRSTGTLEPGIYRLTVEMRVRAEDETVNLASHDFEFAFGAR